MSKRLILLLAIFFLLSVRLFALTAFDIFDADRGELEDMAGLRGIETAGISDNELRNRLYEHEGVDHYEEVVSNLADSYTVTINHTDSLSSVSGITTLRGNVSLLFTFQNGNRNLSSDLVIIDNDRKLLSAIGNVSFVEDDSSGGNTINADIVTFYWDRGTLYVERAATSSEKDLDTSTTPITVYSVGDKLTFLDNGTIVYEDGFIASSEKDPHSSISASEIMMLPGSDMLIENAILRIGRVPVFYFPVFFYPGSVITGNPAFGFSSSKGAFLNTTFELLGHTDLISDSQNSSFLAIFDNSNGDRSNLIPNGAYYSEGEPEGWQKWAFDTDSHIAVLADAYSSVGIHLGLDMKLNFLSGKLSLSTLSGIAFSRQSRGPLGNFRYYGVNAFSYDDFGLALDVSIPFYSDRSVMNEFQNRLTNFSIEPLFGQSPTFPETYSTYLSSFTRSISLSYSLPSAYETNYLSDFRLSELMLQSRYTWSSTQNRYIIDELVLPVFDFALSGSFFDENFLKEKADVVEKKIDTQDRLLISDPLLYPIFEPEITAKSVSQTEDYSFVMRYSFSENLQNEYGYTNGTESDSFFSSESEFNLEFLLNAGKYLQIEDTITPYYDYQSQWDQSLSEENHDFRLTNALDVTIPYIGLEYRLTNRLYTWNRDFENGIVDQSTTALGFDEDSVLMHSIGLNKSFETEFGIFTPSISYTLYPLVGSLNPAFSYRFRDFAVAISYRMEEDEDQNKLLSDLAALSIAYDSTYFTTSWRFEYDTSELYSSTDYLRPFDVTANVGFRTKDRKWAITERVVYEGFSDSESAVNYFSEIRTVLTLPFTEISLNFEGSMGAVEFSSLDFVFDMEEQVFQFWKGRIYLSLGLFVELHYDALNPYSSYFIFEPSVTFSIAEFCDLKFSLRSVNNNFGTYFDSDGNFSFSSLWEDFLRSFDIFSGGNRNTNFNMESLSIEFVHYMADWDLHCRYTASVALSNGSYRFMPEFAVYLSWKTFPDLKVDQAWENRSGSWQRTESPFV